MGKWKAVRSEPDGKLELYDLEADLGETNDVSAEHPEAMTHVEEYLRAARVSPQKQSEPEHNYWERKG